MKPIQIPFPKVAAFLMVTGVFLLGAATGRAAVTLMPPDFPDAKWSVRGYKAGAVVEQVELHNENWLRISRTGAGTDQPLDNSAQVIYNAGFSTDGVPISNEANQLGDLTGSVILGSSSWATADRAVGLTLRAAGTAFNNQSAYFLAINNEGIGLYWGVGSEFVSLNYRLELAPFGQGVSLGTLTSSNNNQYLLEFSFIGNHLTASLWKLDAAGLPTGTAMASLEYFDTRPQYRAEGYFGVRSARWSGNTHGYFRNLEVQAIPEPSTVGLVLMSVVAGLVFIAIRRKSSTETI